MGLVVRKVSLVLKSIPSAYIERPSADAADPILSLSETLGVSGPLWRSLEKPGGSLGAPYTLYMDAIYSEITVNGVSFDHIQCIWTPFTVNSLSMEVRLTIYNVNGIHLQ